MKQRITFLPVKADDPNVQCLTLSCAQCGNLSYTLFTPPFPNTPISILTQAINQALEFECDHKTRAEDGKHE